MFNFTEKSILLSDDFKVVSSNDDTHDFIIEDSCGNLYVCNIAVIDTIRVGKRLLGDLK